MAINLGTIFAQIGLNTSLLQSGVSKAQTQLTKADRSIGGFIKRNEKNLMKFGAIGATAVAAIGIASIKMAGDFDQAMRNVNTITKLSEEQFRLMKEEVIDLSREVPLTTAELSEGLFNVASAGVDAADQMNFLATSSKAAVAGQANLAITVKGLTGVIKGYGDEFSNADKVADLFFKTNELGVTTFEELASSMGKVVPIASSLGVTQEELFASMATLTGVTGNTTEVVTQLKAAFTNLIKPSKEAQEIAEQLGISFNATSIETLGLAGFLEQIQTATGGNVEMMGKLFGSVEGLNAILALTGSSSEKFSENLDAMADSAGAATDAFSEQQKGLNNQLKILKNNVAAIALDIGGKIIPALTDLTTKINELDDDTKDTIATVAQWGVGVLGVVSVIALLTGAVSKLAKGLKPLMIIAPFIAKWATLATIALLVSKAFSNVTEKIIGVSTQTTSYVEKVKSSISIFIELIQILTLYPPLYGKIIGGLGGVRKATEEAETTTVDYTGAMEGMEAASKKAAGEQNTLAIEAEETAAAIEEQKQAIDDLKKAYNELIDAAFGLTNAENDLQEAEWGLDDARKAVIEATEKYGEGSREAAQATNELDEAMQENLGTLGNLYTEEGIALARKEELKNEYISLAAEAILSGKMSERAAIEMAKQFGISGKEIYEMMIEIKSQTDNATGGVSRLQQEIDKLQSKEITIHTIFKQSRIAAAGTMDFQTGGVIRGFDTGGAIRGYQGGGPTSQRTVLVGERGPELATLPMGTRITPNNQLKQVLGSNQDIPPIVIPVTVELDGEVLYESNQKIENIEEFRRIS